MNNLFKFFLIILIIYFIKCSYNTNNEKYTEILENKHHYNYNINDTMLCELAFAILNKAKKDKILLDKIEKKIIMIYNDMKTNNQLKYYLKFMNLVNDDGFIFFENNITDVYLTAKIKVILVLLPSDHMKQLYKNLVSK